MVCRMVHDDTKASANIMVVPSGHLYFIRVSKLLFFSESRRQVNMTAVKKRDFTPRCFSKGTPIKSRWYLNLCFRGLVVVVCIKFVRIYLTFSLASACQRIVQLFHFFSQNTAIQLPCYMGVFKMGERDLTRCEFNPLAPGRCSNTFKSINFKLII